MRTTDDIERIEGDELDEVLAMIDAGLAEDEITITTLSEMVGERFGYAPDTMARKIGVARQRGWMTVMVAEQVLHVLGRALPRDDEVAEAPGLDAWCPLCRQMCATTHEGLCIWCDTQTGGNTTLRPSPATRAHAGVPYMASEEVILEARRLYLTGMSFRQVAQEMVEQTGYASAKCLATSLSDIFRYRGWAARDRIAATQAASYRHGLARRGERHPHYKARLARMRGTHRPRCAATKTQAPGKGRPCAHPAMQGSDYCAQHAPERQEAIRAHLAEMRARRGAAGS